MGWQSLAVLIASQCKHTMNFSHQLFQSTNCFVSLWGDASKMSDRKKREEFFLICKFKTSHRLRSAPSVFNLGSHCSPWNLSRLLCFSLCWAGKSVILSPQNGSSVSSFPAVISFHFVLDICLSELRERGVKAFVSLGKKKKTRTNFVVFYRKFASFFFSLFSLNQKEIKCFCEWSLCLVYLSTLTSWCFDGSESFALVLSAFLFLPFVDSTSGANDCSPRESFSISAPNWWRAVMVDGVGSGML